jgi:hypothetical protein
MILKFLAYPIHRSDWQRPTGSRDYRITNHYSSVDILNGGMHRAVDVGNFREGDPVYSPGPCSAIALRHTDGALGVRFYAPNGEVWELWHLDRTDISGTQRTNVRAGQQVGITGNTGARLPSGAEMPKHTHIEREVNGARVDPEPYLLGQDYNWTGIEEGDLVPRLRPVREQWDIPSGTPFWLDGPEQGIPKSFTSPERRWSISESVDGLWRTIEYGDEVLWLKRSDIVPRAGTRNPKTGYGTPSLGLSETQAKARELNAADKVLEAAKAAAKTYGAT